VPVTILEWTKWANINKPCITHPQHYTVPARVLYV
jgi:hypothetical protein